MKQRALEFAVKVVAGARLWLTRMLVQQIINEISDKEVENE